ncbi:MAG: hypothetical protein ACLP2P_09685 [Desulfobaccales bacterium]
MPTLHQAKWPIPMDWQEFQRMTCDLYKELLDNQDIQEFGSLGQRQNGIDIFGFINGTKNIAGIQCKCVERLTLTEVEDEYYKSLRFVPELSKFIITTTTKRDKDIQIKATEISQNGTYPCVIIFWEDYCHNLASYPNVAKKYYSNFFIIETQYDSPGKLIKIGIDVNHYEILVSRLNPDDKHYGGTILISDLLSRKCITYRLGDHWSRLEGIIGINKVDAFLVSKWLNTFEKIEDILALGNTIKSYEITEQDRREAEEKGFLI